MAPPTLSLSDLARRIATEHVELSRAITEAELLILERSAREAAALANARAEIATAVVECGVILERCGARR